MNMIIATRHGLKIGDLISFNGETFRVTSVLDPNTITFRELRWYDTPVLWWLAASAWLNGWRERLNA